MTGLAIFMKPFTGLESVDAGPVHATRRTKPPLPANREIASAVQPSTDCIRTSPGTPDERLELAPNRKAHGRIARTHFTGGPRSLEHFAGPVPIRSGKPAHDARELFARLSNARVAPGRVLETLCSRIVHEPMVADIGRGYKPSAFFVTGIVRDSLA
jgi:hypothetical protein